ncbi:MAG: HDOD domain-containing protein [Phycisphaerae bacterium]|nr:HDOD domain-containing protein [Phycisphaerae bacterium]
MPDRSAQIDLILRQVDSLPTLSTVATRLLQIGSLEDADLDPIVEILEADPAMTARLLAMCRRADRGLGDRITTVRRAVVMLGIEAVQAAVLSVAVFQAMSACAPRTDEPESPRDDATASFDREGFWRHSVATACAAERLAESHMDLGVRPEEAFVAGLLHDLGKLVLLLVLPRAYARVLGLAERRQASATEAELALLGVDHHTAGKRLAEHWNLPAPLRDAIWLHGQPPESFADSPHRNLVGIVAVARALCRHQHLGWSGDHNHPEPLDGPRGLCRRFGLAPELVTAAVGNVHDDTLQRCAALGLGELTPPELLAQALTSANARLGRLSEILEQRARSAQRLGRALDAVREFHEWAASAADRGVLGALAAVVRSASATLGPGLLGVAFQPAPDEPWQLLAAFDPEGRPKLSELLQPPTHLASLASLCGPAAPHADSAQVAAFLATRLPGQADPSRLHLLPITPNPSSHDSDRAAAVLIHDRVAAGASDRSILDALIATWSAAVRAGARHDAAARLSERLASANALLVEAQSRLAQADAMARLGVMTAGAAHEINNPLTVISGRAQLLADSLQGPEQASARAIVEAAEHVASLIADLRQIAEPAFNLAPTDLPALVQRAVAAAEHRTGITGRVRVIGPASPPPVLLDGSLVANALEEVVANALQAGGNAPVRLSLHPPASDGRLLFVVEDQGAGMSERALQHAFDPFFSEKPAGRRTGLGLTRALRFVELHQGEIRLRSAPGHGTTATIDLHAPACQADRQAA